MSPRTGLARPFVTPRDLGPLREPGTLEHLPATAAHDIDKDDVSLGNCRAATADAAPLLVQPPVGAKVYQPLVIR